MKNVLTVWPYIQDSLIQNYLLLFLDYDGTLTPIVETPDQAFFPKENRELLEKLSKTPDCTVAVLSGRGLADIKNKIGIKNLVYIGNHGFEMEGPDIKFSSVITPQLKKVLLQIKDQLNNTLGDIPGVLIEDKGLTLSIHYRLIDEKDVRLLKRIFRRITVPYLRSREIRTGIGKKVFEIRPPIEWDKGKAVLWLLKKKKLSVSNSTVFPVCVGDDVTDEDAFSAIKNRGLGIIVGRVPHSKAHYYLEDTREVTEFLKKLLELRKIAYASNDPS